MHTRACDTNCNDQDPGALTDSQLAAQSGGVSEMMSMNMQFFASPHGPRIETTSWQSPPAVLYP